MNRQQVFKQMEEVFGLVPSFFKSVPDSTLELEWQLMKKIQLDDGAIPQKYRELIGVGISATTKCQYCIFFHTEMARLFGATEQEIEEAVHYAKSSAGWSAYLNGMQLDLEQFRGEIKKIAQHVKMSQMGGTTAGKRVDVQKHS